MTDQPPAEPTPRRDVGPYASVSEARTQYAATIHGIPTPTTEHLSAASSLVLSEALLLGGVALSEFETRERDALARELDPHTIQVIAGWIVRAHLTGAGVTSP